MGRATRRLCLAVVLVGALAPACGESPTRSTRPRLGVTVPVSVLGSLPSAGSVATLLAPSIVDVSPLSGDGGTRVTITGSNLGRVTSVRFGGVPTRTFKVVSPTRVTAVVPCGARTGEISVVTPTATAVGTSVFRVADGSTFPRAAVVRPGNGWVGDSVLIEGVNLGCTTGVLLDRVPMKFTILAENLLTAIVPEGVGGGYITLRSLVAGFTKVDASWFRVLPPAVERSSRLVGRAGTRISVSGLGFLGVTDVRSRPYGSLTFAVVSSTELQVLIPPTAQGRLTVEILGPGGRDSAVVDVSA